jgi:hypothetical protein
MKASYDKAMDKAVYTGHLLMNKPGVVVPNNIILDVQAMSGCAAKALAPIGPKVDFAPEGAST